MERSNKSTLQIDNQLIELLTLEQEILDGHLPTMEQLLVIPAEIRKKSPLILRVECENGLLEGRLLETQRLLETALKGFAAQADEVSMLTLMGMLSLLYEQVGDRQESQPILALLWQEWSRSPGTCSGFVPWALARAIASGSLPRPGTLSSEELFIEAADRFREEINPLWVGFALLDRYLFSPDPMLLNDHEWQLRLSWLYRNLSEEPYGKAICEILMNLQPSIQICDELPLRYAFLCKAILMDTGEEVVPASLAEDIEVQYYAVAAMTKRFIEERKGEEAAQLIVRLESYHKRVITPETMRIMTKLQESSAALKESSVSAAGLRVQAMHESHPIWQVKLIDGIRFVTASEFVAEPLWKRRKAGELLTYLLLQPNYKANRAHVIEYVFGEGEPFKRSNQLYVTLHDLRQSLKTLGMPEDIIYARRGLIGIDEHYFSSIDIETYLTLSRVGDQLWMDDREAAYHLYEEALPLYGLLGKELPYSDWLERMKEQLLDRHTVMLKRLAMYDMEHQDVERAEQRYTDLIALRPDQEDGYEALIRFHVSLERKSEATSWFRRLEKMCREELGREPLEEIRALLWN